MAITTFIGFYYVENDPNGFIDNAFGYNEDISNHVGEGKSITFNDVLAKFSSPLVLSKTNGLATQKYIIDNFGFMGTPDDLSNINTQSDGWDKVFNIASYIYHSIPNTRIDDIEKVLTGQVEDPSWTKTLFYGYKEESLIIVMRGDAPNKLEQFTFGIYPTDDKPLRTITMYVNPEAFVTKFTTMFPYIYVYYTLDPTIDRDEQTIVLSSIFNNIGRTIVNDYRHIQVPIYSVTSAETIPFHIYTRSIIIPEDILSTPIFLEAIRSAIRSKEPELSEEQLILKYPTIFIEEARTIWPFFENETVKSYQVQDPYSGNPIAYLSNPIQIGVISDMITGMQVLQGYSMFEITTVAHSWIPLMVCGNRGALTDRIPKYRPLLEDIDSISNEDYNAKAFNRWLTMILNYIMGSNTITQLDKENMGFGETTQYVSFKMCGVEWRVYKRGYTTPFDSIP